MLVACALAAIGAPRVQAQDAEAVLHNFANAPNGASPRAGVIRDSAGNLYGTTNNGGPADVGVVYKLDASGHQTVLHGFTGGPDGAYPQAGVILDSAGNLYGTTYSGGSANAGVVYKLDTTRHETVLYSFTGGADGGYPYAGVSLDSAGNLYGTTYNGGTANAGVVYKLDATGHETVLYSFTGGADGANPYAGVIRDAAGNFYGTTFFGGAWGSGVIYKLDPAGHETLLYTFFGESDGGRPYAGVIRDSAGNLYGTNSGVTGPAGVVYELDTTGDYTVLYSFTGGDDGAFPDTGVVRDSVGNLYGTTPEGGTGSWGVVYKLDRSGNEAVLCNFGYGANGQYPLAGVILDTAGNLYGTTSTGGTNWGIVYKLSPAGQETVLYSFTGGADGTYPQAGVIRDSAGNLYGTTYYGGPANAGVVYKLAATGQETVLHTFEGGVDGMYPYAGVVRDPAGNLYGTTLFGGTGNAGTVYKLDAAGNETVLHDFSGGDDGGYPYGGVILDSEGNLYGTASGGGAAGAGVVFELSPTGSETMLYSFTGNADGDFPRAGVIRDPQGNLYGTTYYGGIGFAGVVYKLDTTGHQTVLCAFFGGVDGGYPNSGVIRDSAGNLYGVISQVVFKLDVTGTETVLYNFTGGTDGGSPDGGVIRDSAGNLYGTAGYGGTAGFGVVYMLSATGQETALYSFTGGTPGGNPSTGVIRDSAGNFYGTLSTGGKTSGGVVFKITAAP
jgi:uncharacterized repeat protein (TIGR03803 family)